MGVVVRTIGKKVIGTIGTRGAGGRCKRIRGVLPSKKLGAFISQMQVVPSMFSNNLATKHGLHHPTFFLFYIYRNAYN